MNTFSRTLVTVMVSAACLFLMTPRLTAALDAETQQLETQALCQAMPYRCPSLRAEAEANPVPPPDETEVLCTRLTVKSHVFGAFGFSKHVGTAAAIEEDRLWATHCRQWQHDKDMAQCTASHTCQPKGYGGGAPVLPSDFSTRTTVRCYTTGGPASRYFQSSLSTTCTSY